MNTLYCLWNWSVLLLLQFNFPLTVSPSFTISGEYGQLGHQTLISSDEPQRVEFFREQQMRVVDVVCGTWNTFAAVVKEEVPSS